MSYEPHVHSVRRQLIEKVLETLTGDLAHEHIIKNQFPETTTKQVITALEKDPSLSDILLETIFQTGIPLDRSFYDKLAHIEYRLGHNTAVQQLNGLLWARSFNRLDSGHGLILLNAFTAKDTPSFFSGLHALPTFLSVCKLDAVFLAEWILNVQIRLGNDMVSGGFWNALQSLSRSFPDVALRVVNILGTRLTSDEAISVAASLLGHLRVTTNNSSDFSEFLDYLYGHNHVDKRIVYLRSWIIVCHHRTLTQQEVWSLIDQASKGTKEEIEEVLKIFGVFLPLPSTSTEIFLAGVRWVHDNTTREASDSWKGTVIYLAQQLHSRWKAVGLPAGVPSLAVLTLELLPIRECNESAWNGIEALLGFLAKDDIATFGNILFGLARRDTQALSNRHKRWKILCGTLAESSSQDKTTIVVDALFSDEKSIRSLGFALFDYLGIVELSDNRVYKASDNRVALLIFSFQQQPFYDEVIPRFLSSLEARVINGSTPLQDLYVSEMVFQSKNLPGICLEALKSRFPDSVLVQKAIVLADEYFDALRPCFRSAINSMGVPGLERAARVKAARQSREMETQVNRESILPLLGSTSYLLYGGKHWQTFVGGKLSEVSELRGYSHSIEFPRMPGIDPDGTAVRYFNATQMIKQLLTREVATDDHDS